MHAEFPIVIFLSSILSHIKITLVDFYNIYGWIFFMSFSTSKSKMLLAREYFGLCFCIFLLWLWTYDYATGTHIAQLPPRNILRKSTSSCNGFLEAASRMQNGIIRSSSGTKNVRFTASWGSPREFPKSISKEGLRKITGTNTGEIKET